MKSDITDKLNFLLNSGFPKNEYEVVYFLVEIRKLIEINSLKDNYKVINFYCDWCCHSKLNFNPFPRNLLIKMQKQIDKIQPLLFEEELRNFVSFDTLRKQLNQLLVNELKIKNNLCHDDSSWLIFRKLLIDIISDCPLEYDIDELEIKRFEYKCDEKGLNFDIELKNGGRIHHTYFDNKND